MKCSIAVTKEEAFRNMAESYRNATKFKALGADTAGMEHHGKYQVWSQLFIKAGGSHAEVREMQKKWKYTKYLNNDG